MAGPIQKAISDVITTGAAITGIGKKLSDDERQAGEKAEAERLASEKETEEAREEETKMMREAESVAMEADLIRMGADPDTVRAFMTARELGLDTSRFGTIRGRGGRFIGTYSSIAERLSRDSLTDSLTSRVINKRGFAERIAALGGGRKGKVDALVKASEGGR